MTGAVSKASLDTPEALRRFSSNALFTFIAQLFHVLVSVDALRDLSAQAIKFQNAVPAAQPRRHSLVQSGTSPAAEPAVPVAAA